MVGGKIAKKVCSELSTNLVVISAVHTRS